MVENPVALRLLEGGAKDGDTVVVDAEDGGLAVRIEHAEPSPIQVGSV